MPSTETTPRFRRLSVVQPSHFTSSSDVFGEKHHEEHRDPEKECFMCRQANVYITPIGMQQERQVAQRHPPPLTRAQIEELSQKKHLTKREARQLLQCYFPEIKNVKYFQLHKYHSCCYDPKHLNLCNNHITSLQHEREAHSNKFPRKHTNDEEHYRAYERNSGQQNRVSFVRIKIEPTKGIPTRFLGPTALPESLADMLIRQVNRFENKKKPPSFGAEPENALQMYNLRRVPQPYNNDTGRLSEYLANLSSDDEDNDSDSDDEKENGVASNATSSIRGYNGKVMDRSRMKYEKKIQVKQEKEKLSAIHSNDDLVVEDIDELNQVFADQRKSPVEHDAPAKSPKKKKRKKRTKKRSQTHPKPKLNHWEILALDQSKQDVCGCRHHVRRLEADQVVYDWCRCKDHRHRDLKERRKSIAPPPPPPPLPPPPPPPSLPSSPPKQPKKRTPPPKTPKIEKRTVAVDATEPMTNELALAYDPSTVEYDVISEALYYRTSSGRLVKPEITNAFTYNSMSPSTAFNQHRSLPKKSQVLYTVTKGPFQSSASGSRQHGTMLGSRATSTIGSISNRQIMNDVEVSSVNNVTEEPVPLLDLQPIASPIKTGEVHTNNDNEDESESEDEDENNGPQFIPPTYVPERSETTPVQSPTLRMAMQKSSKPTYTNQRPTPNFERESSVLASRRWFDQPLGDQNLLPVHDGRYGLIAGTSAEEYLISDQLPDNEYAEPYRHERRSNCTIS